MVPSYQHPCQDAPRGRPDRFGRGDRGHLSGIVRTRHARRLRLMGQTLSGLRIDIGGKVAYATISRDDLERTGAIAQDSEDLVDWTVSMREVEVGMLFIEQARGGVKVSFRARQGLDCSRLAASLGGGGHTAAAGATLPGSMAESVDRVLSAVRQALDHDRGHATIVLMTWGAGGVDV